MEDLTGRVFGISSLKASVTASGLVYLFYEELGKWPNISRNRFQEVASTLWIPQQKDAGYAKRLFEAALISLADEGYVSLRTEKRKWLLLLSREVVIITKRKKGYDLPASLERAIMDALREDHKLALVEEVVARVIGGRQLDNPWKWVVEYVMERLVETGCLVREVKKRRFWWDKVHVRADEEAVAFLAGKAERLKASLAAFTSHSPELHKRLVRGLSRGFERVLPPSDYN